MPDVDAEFPGLVHQINELLDLAIKENDHAAASFLQWFVNEQVEEQAPARAELDIHLAPAGLLAQVHPLSRPFPGGYRGIAALLDPHRVWAAWTVRAPGQRQGMAYDGLVWLDDHWAWLPKPYRVLAGMPAEAPAAPVAPPGFSAGAAGR